MTDKLEGQIRDLEKRVTRIEIDKAGIQSQVASIGADVKEIKDSQKWVIKLVIGLLITALVGIVTGGGLTLG